MNAHAKPPISASEARADRIYQALCEQASIDAVAVVAACDTALQGLQDRLPEPVFYGAGPFWSMTVRDAASWAEYASEGQVIAMMIACLDRIGGAKVALQDRKRLLVAIWNTLPPEDRQAFREKVAGK